MQAWLIVNIILTIIAGVAVFKMKDDTNDGDMGKGILTIGISIVTSMSWIILAVTYLFQHISFN